MKPRFLLPLIACLLVGFYSPALARTISWSNQAFDELYDSQGTALDSTFSFEIGMFAAGFNPADQPIEAWAANWIVFDRAFYDTSVADPEEGGWNVDFQYFASEAGHLSSGLSDSPYATPGQAFPLNSQAYIWVYNSKDIAFTSEWALVADVGGWTFPDPADTISPTLIWSLSDADTALFGAVDSGSSTGDGSVSNQPGSYSLQTYQVPEPGGALLIASAGLLFMLRRARLLRR